MAVTTLDAVTEYAERVVSGDEIAGRLVRLACERHLRDLERQGTDDFPWVFDPARAERVFAFFRFCRHVKGPLAGQPIELMPWQKFIIGSIFGWVHRDTGLRRFRKAYVQVARGNGKSTLLSGLGLYMLMADGEAGAEVYATATKKEQARIVYDAARIMAIRSPDLLKRLEPGKAEIIHPATASRFMPLSKDTKSLDGLNPHLGIIDEFHAHPTREMYDLLVTAMGKRLQPLLFIITTAGDDLSSPCYEEYLYLCKLLLGEVVNERYFAYIAQLDPEDNPQDESVWIKANPLLATTDHGMEYLRNELRAALDVPSAMRAFLTRNMNLWVDQREDGYMPMDRWRACAASDNNPMPELTGRECYVGVDLSTRIDLTSVAIEFPLGDGRYAVRSHSFVPAEKLAERRKKDKQPYDLWVRQGWLSEIPGAVVDHLVVADWIDAQVEANGWVVRELVIDPALAAQFGLEMQRRGYTVVELPQTFRHLSEPTKHLREQVLAGRLIHDGSPVLTWAMSNAVEHADDRGNIMVSKKKSRDRIDPVAALINAHARAMHWQSGGDYDPNAYADDEFLDKLWG